MTDPRIKFDVDEVDGGWIVRGSLPAVYRKDYRTPTMDPLELAIAKQRITQALLFHEKAMLNTADEANAR